MRKLKPGEEALGRLGELRKNPSAPGAAEELARYLGDRYSFVASKAARIAGEAKLADLIPQLEAAFDRFMKDPGQTDKGCSAKIEIAKALLAMEHSGSELFLRGMRHVQVEPSFGRSIDTAAELRGVCAIGLAQTYYPDPVSELADLLADPEPEARAGAARAIGGAGRPEGALLLRLKVLMGDESSAVMGECFGALLGAAAERSLPLVGRFLANPDLAIAQAAAEALGESRLEGAFEILKARVSTAMDPDFRGSLLLAIAMLRRDEPLQYLLSMIAGARLREAADAIRALAISRHDERIRSDVEKAVLTRADPDLERVLRKEFR